MRCVILNINFLVKPKIDCSAKFEACVEYYACVYNIIWKLRNRCVRWGIISIPSMLRVIPGRTGGRWVRWLISWRKVAICAAREREEVPRSPLCACRRSYIICARDSLSTKCVCISSSWMAAIWARKVNKPRPVARLQSGLGRLFAEISAADPPGSTICLLRYGAHLLSLCWVKCMYCRRRFRTQCACKFAC